MTVPPLGDTEQAQGCRQGTLPLGPASLRRCREAREMLGSPWESRGCPPPSYLQPFASWFTAEGISRRLAKHSLAALFAKHKPGNSDCNQCRPG